MVVGEEGADGVDKVSTEVAFFFVCLQRETDVQLELAFLPSPRSFTLQTPPLALHLHLLLLHLRNISSLTLNCKLTTVTTQKLLLPLLPQSLPNLLSLNLAFAEDLRPALVGSIAERLPTSLERLGLSTIFMDGGLLAEVVMWEENEIVSLVSVFDASTSRLLPVQRTTDTETLLIATHRTRFFSFSLKESPPSPPSRFHFISSLPSPSTSSSSTTPSIPRQIPSFSSSLTVANGEIDLGLYLGSG